MGLNKSISFGNFTLSSLHFNYSYILDWNNDLIPRPDNWKLQQTVYTITQSMFVFLGVFLNLLTIITILRGKHSGKGVKIQLINLAVADLISAATLPITLMRQIDLPHSDAFCKVFSTVTHGVFGVSTLWNMTISLERVIIYYFPLKARRYRRKHKLIVAACVWCIGLIINVENAIHAQSYRGKCIMVMAGIPQAGTGWLMALRWIIPILIIVISYLLIGIKMCTEKKIGEVGSGSQEEHTHKTRIQVYRMLAVDASVTVITWLPYCILNIIYAGRVFGDGNVTEARRAILSVEVLGGLLETNVFSSPIIYFVCSQSIRSWDCMVTGLLHNANTIDRCRALEGFIKREMSKNYSEICQYGLVVYHTIQTAMQQDISPQGNLDIYPHGRHQEPLRGVLEEKKESAPQAKIFLSLNKPTFSPNLP